MVELSLCLMKYNTMKMYPVLIQTPSHEDVMGEWR